ncbi:WD40 repeat-like protein [Saccharata proteae CBS 121410]|uniref:Polyadenylation factor subunit 2 n=1 Tax=Saccharata proteae CBS 121410 TaxID=1314787 RepID=A0A9P4HTF1_9PEZI|nr:WD40 repeat-like protein [Saccharata proteae CBS 121410]
MRRPCIVIGDNANHRLGAVTDYGSTMVQWSRNRRPPYRGASKLEIERPSASYIVDMLPPAARPTNAAESIPAKHLHASLNKVKHPINVVRWTPEGRRLLTGSTSGEFTLWNGMAFNFETIMQAHDSAVRAASYSHSDDWLVSADQDGVVKYWQPNFNNVKALQAHNEPIRDLAFAPTDSKFVTASDDATLKIFDFAGGIEESTLTGHGWEAKSVDWHPTKGLLVSGSKDHQVKLWDPRTGRCLTTLHGHKNTISKTSFEPTQGQLLATCARDHTARVFDLRMMRDVLLLRGHEKDITTLTWHPIHKNLLSTGSNDGSLHHYLLDEQNSPPGIDPTLSPYDHPDPDNAPAQTIYPAHRVPHAHDFAIWTLDWHPLGHILASGSNDRITRFWTRPRPGETFPFNDRYHIGQAQAEAQGIYDRRDARRQMQQEEEQEAQDEEEGLIDQKMPAKLPTLPGLPGLNALAQDGSSTGGAQLTGLLPGMQMQMGIHGLPPPPPPPHLAGFAPPGTHGGIPPPPLGALPPGMDLGKLAEMMAKGGLPLPPPPPGGLPFMPPPGFPGAGAMGKPGMPPMPVPGMPPPPPGFGVPGMGGVPGFGAQGGNGQMRSGDENGAGVGSGNRRRAPLPSQKESLQEEMRRGKFRTAR